MGADSRVDIKNFDQWARRQALEFFVYFRYRALIFWLVALLALFQFGVVVLEYRHGNQMFPMAYVVFGVYLIYFALMGVVWYRIRRISKEFCERYAAGEWRNWELGSESELAWRSAGTLGTALMVISAMWGPIVGSALLFGLLLSRLH